MFYNKDVKKYLILICLLFFNTSIFAGLPVEYESSLVTNSLLPEGYPGRRIDFDLLARANGDETGDPMDETAAVYTTAEIATLITMPILGGLGMGTLAAVSFLSEIKNPVTQSLLLLIPTSCGALGNYLFTKVLIDRKYHWNWSLLYGLGAGAIVGLVGGLLCMESVMLIGTAIGEVVMNEPVSTLELMGAAALVGGGMGCLFGACLGLIEAPIISLVLKY